jgi:hypothetical protein
MLKLMGVLLDSLKEAEHSENWSSCFRQEIKAEIPPTSGMNM